MICPSCGKENASASGQCVACGRPLAPVPGTFPATDQSAPAPSRYGSVPVPPQRKRSQALVVTLAVAFAVVVFLVSKINHENPDQRIGRLMREAAGLQPVHESFFSGDRHFDDTFREQYRNLFQANKDYIEASGKLDLSATATLGTPDSFADPSIATEGLKQLHAAYDLDRAQEEKVQQFVHNIEQALATSDWASSNRQAYEAGFKQGMVEPITRRKRATSAEAEWIQSVDDTYAFAQDNHAVLSSNGGQLRITDEEVRQAFNLRIRTMNARRTEFLQAKQDFEQWQAELFKKMGVNSKSFGLPK